MFDSIRVVGRGRVGSAIAARLHERGVAIRDDRVDLVLLCVPDAAIRDVARAIDPGPWIAHVSGATPLAALDPHVRRFSVHPLQTFTRARGAEQLDGAWAAVIAESDAARARGRWLATLLNLRPFDLEDEVRTVYHAGAAIASNYLVTLYRAAARLFEAAGAPPEALLPLMRRTIDNGFELTGPIARGDWSTVDAHLVAIRRHAPELEADVPGACRGDGGMKIVRTIGEVRDLLRPLRPHAPIGLVPTMGAFHDGHIALFQAARAECDPVVASLFVNPSQFGDPADLAAYPRDEAGDARIAEQSGVDVLFAPAIAEMFPSGYTTWIEIDGAARGLEGDHRPGHFRGVATVCVKLFTIVGPRVAFFGQKDAQQVAVVRQVVRDLNLDLDDPRRADRPRRRRPGALLAEHPALAGRPRARRAPSRARSKPAWRPIARAGTPSPRRARRLATSMPTTWRSPTSTAADAGDGRPGRWHAARSTTFPLTDDESGWSRDMNTKVSLGDFAAMKQRHEKIAVVTAYDAPSARLADAAGVDVVLVGDSAAMTVLGTIPPCRSRWTRC